MPKYTTLLVGAHFRPPAKQILTHLPQGAALTMEREPDNPYDPLAIKVFVNVQTELPESEHPALQNELPNAGCTLEEVLSGETVWLGYIPKEDGKPLQKAREGGEPDLIGNETVQGFLDLGESEYEASLSFAADGSPRLQIETRDYPDSEEG